jgi:hypothetical protein
MKDNQFVIVGPVQTEQTYWNVNTESWKEGLDQASLFPKGIFGITPPPGAMGIMEFTSELEYVEFYKHYPSWEGAKNLSEKP